jgi:hypothetical protein
MDRCPRCMSHKVHPSRIRSFWETWRRQITLSRPYRCSNCSWRGWAPDTGPRFNADAIELSQRAMVQDRRQLDEPSYAGAERRTAPRGSRSVSVD